jgi:hypothetical protein
VLFEETSGNLYFTIVMKRVALAASTTLALVMQSYFLLTKQGTLAVATGAMRSHGPFQTEHW